MAQRGKSDGRGRRSARPTSGRRVDGRRADPRRESRRGESRSTPVPNRSDAAGFEPDGVETAGIDGEGVDTGQAATGRRVADPGTGRVRGLSPKRAVVLALVLSVVALTLAVPLRTYFSQRSEFEQLRSTNAALRQGVSDMQRKVDEQGDPANVMAQARDRLQFVMPGDKALVMQFPAPPEKSDEEKRAEQRANNPWYSNLLESVSTPTGK